MYSQGFASSRGKSFFKHTDPAVLQITSSIGFHYFVPDEVSFLIRAKIKPTFKFMNMKSPLGSN